MGKGRLEVFSGDIIAIIIIITIMAMELKVLHGASFNDMLRMLVSYVLGFIYVGTYWKKHRSACYPSGKRHAVLGTLGIAILVSGCAPKLDESDEELEVQQAVLRYQFEYNAAAGKYDIFCVAIGDREASLDAPTKLIEGLNDANRKVVKFAACDENDGNGVIERASGKPALILRVAQVKWLAKNEAVVDGGYYEASLSSSGNTYHLKKIDGIWRVKKNELNWIS